MNILCGLSPAEDAVFFLAAVLFLLTGARLTAVAAFLTVGRFAVVAFFTVLLTAGFLAAGILLLHLDVSCRKHFFFNKWRDRHIAKQSQPATSRHGCLELLLGDVHF
jgi:hypothetical protein